MRSPHRMRGALFGLLLGASFAACGDAPRRGSDDDDGGGETVSGGGGDSSVAATGSTGASDAQVATTSTAADMESASSGGEPYPLCDAYAAKWCGCLGELAADDCHQTLVENCQDAYDICDGTPASVNCMLDNRCDQLAEACQDVYC